MCTTAVAAGVTAALPALSLFPRPWHRPSAPPAPRLSTTHTPAPSLPPGQRKHHAGAAAAGAGGRLPRPPRRRRRRRRPAIRAAAVWRPGGTAATAVGAVPGRAAGAWVCGPSGASGSGSSRPAVWLLGAASSCYLRSCQLAFAPPLRCCHCYPVSSSALAQPPFLPMHASLAYDFSD